ncbi:MAG: DnaA regulatory inactivator Hda [Gammaproteobacteria bacterium]|nr:DnaA regulatory inactivator Hda [Gammaproteobacteria bacterium]
MQPLLGQLTLKLMRDEAVFDNFYPGNNAEIIDILKKSVIGIGEQVIYLCGTRGHGLTHLLHACCHEAHQQKLSSIYLPLASLLSLSPELLKGCEAMNVVCLDDIQVIAANPHWEEAVFHLYNRVYDMGGRIIMAAKTLPKTLNLHLPDLVSRLSWGVVYQLHPLDDREKLNALIMRAERRGISLSNETGNYLLTHCPRQMNTLFAALDALDKASLAAKRRLTIPFVKEVLQI